VIRRKLPVTKFDPFLANILAINIFIRSYSEAPAVPVFAGRERERERERERGRERDHIFYLLRYKVSCETLHS